jgi:hypothetical protein
MFFLPFVGKIFGPSVIGLQFFGSPLPKKSLIVIFSHF